MVAHVPRKAARLCPPRSTWLFILSGVAQILIWNGVVSVLTFLGLSLCAYVGVGCKILFVPKHAVLLTVSFPIGDGDGARVGGTILVSSLPSWY